MTYVAHTAQHRRELRRGFTIVELLVVILVIGILAAITIVGYKGVQDNAAKVSVQSDVDHAATAVTGVYQKNNRYPNAASEVNNGSGFALSEGNTADYIKNGDWYCVAVTSSRSGVPSAFRTSDGNKIESGLCPALQPNAGVVTLVAGSGTAGMSTGTGSSAQFNGPYGVAVNPLIGTVYVADTSNNRIRGLNNNGTGAALVIAGTGTAGFANGPATILATFNAPRDIAVGLDGNVYVTDSANNCIRKVNMKNGIVTTLAGNGTSGFADSTDGTGQTARFNSPYGIDIDENGMLYVADTNNHRIRSVDPNTGETSTIAGSGVSGNADGNGIAATLATPTGLTVTADGTVYFTQYTGLIRKVSTTGQVTTIAGTPGFGYVDGASTAARFNGPGGIAVDGRNYLYIADTGNHRIRMVAPDGTVSTLAGSGTSGGTNATGTAASFNTPYSLDINPRTGELFVAEAGGHRIRKIR